MKIKSLVANLYSWISSTELFARPSKQIPGKWELFEYYTEVGDELIHVEENQLKKDNQYWRMEFFEDEQLFQNKNIKLFFSNETEKLRWKLSGLNIFFENQANKNENIRCRYAVGKEELRLLKKFASGKIEFFGFFRKASL